MDRRKILTGSVAVAGLSVAGGLLGASPASAANARLQSAQSFKTYEDDHSLGKANAPITIVEFASLTCPHCAAFHADTFPQLEETWIADGRARMVFRHYPLDALALRASAVSECFDGERFFGFIGLLFKTQAQWSRADDPINALRGLSRQAGMNDETFDSCVNDEATLDRILQKVVDARNDHQIQSTPSFVINGRKVEGARSFEELQEVLEAVPTNS